jgi:hypothetical protein
MTWVKVDDDMPWHRKFRQAGDLRALCLALDLTGMCHAAKYLTDGFVSDGDLPGVLDVIPRNRRTVVLGLLVEIRRWERDDHRSGYWVRNYLRYNPSAKDETQRRERHADATRRYRERQRSDQSPTDSVSGHGDVSDRGVTLPPVIGRDSAPSPRGLQKPKGQASVTPPSRDPSPDPDPPAASPAGSSQAAADLAAEPQNPANNGQPPTEAQRAALRAALERRRQDADAEAVSDP